jgi:hypothetical protein
LAGKENLREGLSLGSYLLLVDYTGRPLRQGKPAISVDLEGIFDRLGSSAMIWRARLEKLRTGRLLGRCLAATRQKLRDVAERLNVRGIANLAGCPGR